MGFLDKFRKKSSKDLLLLSDQGTRSKQSIDKQSIWIDERRLVIEASEWAYRSVPEVSLAYDKMAETVVKAIFIPDDTYSDVKNYHKKVNIKARIHNIIVQSLQFGSALMFMNMNHFEVKNTIDFIWNTDTKNNISKMVMRKDVDYKLSSQDLISINSDVEVVPPTKYYFYVPFPRYTGDLFGKVYLESSLIYIDRLEGVMNAISKSTDRYLKPFFVVNAPEGSSSTERTTVYNQLTKNKDIDDMIFPNGYEATLHGTSDFYTGKELVEMITQKIITGLGLPKLVFGIPGDSNRASARYSMDILYDKIQPLAEILQEYLNNRYEKLFGVMPFEIKKLSPLDVEQVSKSVMLVSQGISMLSKALDSENITPQVRKKINDLIMEMEIEKT